MSMTKEEAISLLTQVNKILVNCNSWLENTHEPLNMAFDMAIKALEQEPKTGHWIDIDGGVECDKCGKWYPHAPIAKNEIKFCSECGAKMVEPQESEGEA